MEPENPLRIHHVVSDIYRGDAGPSYSVPRLAEAQSALGQEVRLHALEPRPVRQPHVESVYYQRSAVMPSIGISNAMRNGLRTAARNADIVHFHGLWMMPNVYPGSAVKGTDCALVMSPRGMLEPWSLRWSRTRKRVFGAALQRRVLERVDLFHATSELEAQSIRAYGLSAPVAIVPIGIDIPHVVQRKRDPSEPRVVLYLGRIHAKKNISAMIEAWAAIAHDHPNWRLIVSGPGEARDLAEIGRLVARTSGAELRGPAYGVEKAQLYRNAELFVLPSHSENFGVVVTEALSHGVPVIATTGTPWQGLKTEGCGWWIEPTRDALSSALNGALALSASELATMGERGRRWMKRDFSWPSVGRRMNDAHRWIRSGGSPPPTIYSK